MLTIKLFLTAALLFLTHSGADGAPGSPMGRKLLQHSASSWTGFQRVEGKELPSWLSWEPFGGELPADTVSNWNAYTNMTEYVCLSKSWHCSTGSYVPSRGPFCTFAFGGLAHNSYEFKVLVNKGKLEALRWVDDSFGDVPENAVEGCESSDIYVGRNRYGLGKVSKEQRALFVTVDGKEVWFKWYQVLTVKTGPAGITISDVLYNVSAAVEHSEDVTITKTTVKNEGCQGTRQDVTLEEATEVEQDWELDQEIFSSVRGVLEAGLLAFNGMSWEATNVINVTWLGKASAGEYIEHTRKVELEMQPRTTCTVAMVGRRLDARIPFTADLTRDFGDGQPHQVEVTGVARSQQVVGVRAGIEWCWPLPGSTRC
ncbi:charged multivesicular body protein 2a isoform X1 [Phasianus colchicus]|uniref:charged multivesicular body protein 2a isoform X1 n=1 Tax=Phasianus colchicus TaxID=9054 RepID=UPI00129DAD23|nr:charged multivesicular body protein 2a isoform X1 [Phasianus colchicus]